MILRAFLFLLMSVSVLFSSMYEYRLKPSTPSVLKDKAINFLDAKELKFKKLNGIKFKELSALAYKDKVLYVLGDKGVLFHLDIEIQDKKIKKIDLLKSLKLKNKKNKKLKKSKRDSEGLYIFNENLLISFEKKPRIEVFSTNAIRIKNKKIHKDLRDIRKYRSSNKALESVAYNERYGIITSPEKSLEKVDEKIHTLYAKKATWKFPSSGSVTALEFIDENNLMILQRSFNVFSRRYIITLSMMNLETSKYTILQSLKSVDGWNLENFEGLTKIDEKHYMMISDDNNSFFQKTVLVLFELSL